MGIYASILVIVAVATMGIHNPALRVSEDIKTPTCWLECGEYIE